MSDTALLDDTTFDAFVPAVRSDVTVRRYDNEAVAWSVDGHQPAHLDAIASLIVGLLDGDASMADLVNDVHEVVGVPKSIARTQLRRVISQLDGAALLTTSTVVTSGDDHHLFVAPPNP